MAMSDIFLDPTFQALAGASGMAAQMAGPSLYKYSTPHVLGNVIGSFASNGADAMKRQQEYAASQAQTQGQNIKNQLDQIGLNYFQNANQNPRVPDSWFGNSPVGMSSPAGSGMSPLTAAQVKYESGGDSNAVSPAGARGLMQLMPGTAKNPGFGVSPAQNETPQENLRVGQDYMNAMLKRYGDTGVALAAYNWGPDNVDKWLHSTGGDFTKLPAETQKYVNNVISELPQGTQPQQVYPQGAAQTQGMQQSQLPGVANGMPVMSPSQMIAQGQQLLRVPGMSQVGYGLIEQGMKAAQSGTQVMPDGSIHAIPGYLPFKASEAAAIEGGKAQFEPTEIRVPDGSGGFVNMQTTKANVPGLLSGGNVVPSKETFSNDAKYFSDTIQPSYESAQQAKEQIATMSNALSNLTKEGQNRLVSLSPGASAAVRRKTAQTLSDIANVFDPSGQQLNDKELAASDAMEKAGNRLGFALSRTLGAREAAQVVQQAISSNPGNSLSPESNKLLIALLDNSADRAIQRYNVGLAEQSRGGLSQKAIAEFDREHPEREFINNAYVSAGVPVNLSKSDKSFFDKLPSGARFIGPDGKERVKP